MVMAFAFVACLIFFDVVINPFPVHPYCQGLYLFSQEEYVIFISVQQSGKNGYRSNGDTYNWLIL